MLPLVTSSGPVSSAITFLMNILVLKKFLNKRLFCDLMVYFTTVKRMNRQVYRSPCEAFGYAS